MPNDGPGVLRGWNTCWSQCKALDTLGIKMNLAMLFTGKAFEQFVVRALFVMAAVFEW